jgi:hypothetical protein
MTREEHREAILDEISLESTDTFITTAILNRFYDRSVRWLGGLKNWQETQIARKQTLTIVGDETDEYWDYPENFKTDSVYRLEINGDRYKQLTFVEYLNFKEDNNSNKKVFADYRRQIFIHPTPTSSADVLSIWANEIPAKATGDDSTHPWENEQLFEEAINRYMIGLVFKKMQGSFYAKGKEMHAEALTLAKQAWDEQRLLQAHRKTETAEVWQHTDFMNQSAGNRVTKRGSFNLDN